MATDCFYAYKMAMRHSEIYILFGDISGNRKIMKLNIYNNMYNTSSCNMFMGKKNRKKVNYCQTCFKHTIKTE